MVDPKKARAATIQRMKEAGKASPRRRVRQLRHPRGQEVRYRAALLSIVRRLHREIRKALLPIIETAARADSAASTPRVKTAARADSAVSDIQAAARRIRRGLTSTILAPKTLTKMARAIAADIARFSSGQMDLLFKGSLGIGLPPGSQELVPLIESFTRDNVALITRMGRQELDKAEKVVLSGLRTGQNNREIAKQLRARLGVSERRARLIARDQTGSLNAEVTQVQNLRMGVTEFTWATVGDERVRPLHEDIDGNVYPVATGHPSEGLPGESINCRCSQSPVLDGLFAGL